MTKLTLLVWGRTSPFGAVMDSLLLVDDFIWKLPKYRASLETEANIGLTSPAHHLHKKGSVKIQEVT